MIRGVGIDSVELARCAIWQHYAAQQLTRIFSSAEIAYCFDHAPSTIQRLAARFAVKEAAYKAVCAAYPDTHIPFLTLCKAVELVQVPHHAPTLYINWSCLQQYNTNITALVCHVSVTHTLIYATAVVILEDPPTRLKLHL
ncbi:MAG: holo-ACP synthase [Candidatus Babeliales bacterium]